MKMAGKLAGDSATPLYQQVANDLREAIVNDVYHVGARIPTEPELSHLYGVSRITVRKAIEILVDEGLLAKRQGKGTFVQEAHRAPMVHEDRRAALNGFSASCRQNGLEPGSTLLRCEVVDVPPVAREFFGEGARLIAIDRVCMADGTPIMVDHCLFAREGHEFLETAELENASIFDLIRNATGSVPPSRQRPDAQYPARRRAGRPCALRPGGKPPLQPGGPVSAIRTGIRCTRASSLSSAHATRSPCDAQPDFSIRLRII